MSVVQLALGSVQFGLAYGISGLRKPVAESEVTAILEEAAAEGITCIDTAPGYGDIENRLPGLATDPRFRFVSKIPAVPRGVSASEAAEFVKQSAARSIGRLGGRLQTLLFHRADDLLEANGDAIWAALEAEARGSGLRLGVSAYGPGEVDVVSARYPVSVAQVPGNAFDQRLDESPVSQDVELHVRSAFLQGLLLMPLGEAAKRVTAAAGPLAAWKNWCLARGISNLEAALGAVKALRGVRYCVVGVDGVEQFHEIVAAWKRARPIIDPALAVRDPDVVDPRRWNVQ